MAQPGTWGGEPELLMLSQHVLEIPLEAKGSAAGPAALLFSHAARSGVFSGGWAVQAPPDILPRHELREPCCALAPAAWDRRSYRERPFGSSSTARGTTKPCCVCKAKVPYLHAVSPNFPTLSCGMALLFIKPRDNRFLIRFDYTDYTSTACLDKTCLGICKMGVPHPASKRLKERSRDVFPRILYGASDQERKHRSET